MRVALTLHPDCVCAAVQRIEVDVEPGAALRYVVTGDTAALLIPAPAAPRRADGLWQHSCFEAFVAGAGSAYREFNFSPSREWAAYVFSGYREGMADAEIAPPRIETVQTPGQFGLRVRLDLDAPIRLGLSAVIEEVGGRKSYWALAHPAAKPDFHDPRGFVLAL